MSTTVRRSFILVLAAIAGGVGSWAIVERVWGDERALRAAAPHTHAVGTQPAARLNLPDKLTGPSNVCSVRAALATYYGETWPLAEAQLADAGVDLDATIDVSTFPDWPTVRAMIGEGDIVTRGDDERHVLDALEWVSESSGRSPTPPPNSAVDALPPALRAELDALISGYDAKLVALGHQAFSQYAEAVLDSWKKNELAHYPIAIVDLDPGSRGFKSSVTVLMRHRWVIAISIPDERAGPYHETLTEIAALKARREESRSDWLASHGIADASR